MKNVNFLLDGLPDVDELYNLLQNMIESGGNFVNYMMKIHDDKKLMPDFIGMTPDTYGCERFYVDFFINDEMREDFPLIARDFYAHEFANIPEHRDVEYFDIQSGEDWPELMFNRFTLGLMMNAVNSGSEYTKALFLCLHKTYYKKEYRTIKRFSTMSLSELLALAEPEGGICPYYAKMSKFLGNVFKWLGYSPEYADWCDENDSRNAQDIGLWRSWYILL